MFRGKMIRQIAKFAALVVLLLGSPGIFASQNSLVMGVFPRRSVPLTRQMYLPLAGYLSRQLQRPVILEVPPDFPAFWNRLRQGAFDLVHSNQYQYIKAHKLFGQRVILMDEEHGSTRMRSVILTRTDGPMKKLEDLRGRMLLFGGGPSAAMSYIMIREMLRQHHLRDSEYLSEFALNPFAAADALFYGQADAAGVAEAVARAANRPWSHSSAFRVLAYSQPIAQLPWSLSRSVDAATGQRIVAALLALNHSEKGRAILARAGLSGLAPARDKDYDSTRVLVARVLGEHY